jgi:hypothetical protein
MCEGVNEGMRARVFLALVVLSTLAFPALAQERRDERAPSLDRVLPQIRRNMPGTFYDAQGPFFSPDGQARYRIKWMTPDGRVIWFYVDARSGRMVGGVPPAGQFGYGPPGRFDNRDWPHQDYDGGRDWNRGGHGNQGNHGDRGNGGDRGGRRPPH